VFLGTFPPQAVCSCGSGSLSRVFPYFAPWKQILSLVERPRDWLLTSRTPLAPALAADIPYHFCHPLLQSPLSLQDYF